VLNSVQLAEGILFVRSREEARSKCPGAKGEDTLFGGLRGRGVSDATARKAPLKFLRPPWKKKKG